MHRLIKKRAENLIVFILLIVILNLCAAKKIYAQVVINEFSSAASTDWVELYSSEEIDISGWILDDEGTKSDIKVFPQGTQIGPSTNSYLVVETSDRLNNGGDIIYLFNKDRTEVDKISYGNKGGVCLALANSSVGRYPDANATIERFKSPSKNTTNNNTELDPCPAPTLEPTTTPVPTSKPMSTPKPTSTPKPVQTQKVTTLTNVPILRTITIAEENNQPTNSTSEDNPATNSALSLGIAEINSAEVVPTPQVLGEKSRKLPPIALTLTVSGLLLSLSAFFPLIKNRFRNRIGNDKKII